MKRVMLIAVPAMALVPLASPSEAASTCMGKPVDVLGTAKDDVFVPNHGDDRNDDGWTVYAGGKGNDLFWQVDVDGGSVTEVIACGYAGDDTIKGAWDKIDGGSGTDRAEIMTCWFDFNAQSIMKVESVGMYYCPEGTP